MHEIRKWRHIGTLSKPCRGQFMGLDPSYTGFGVCVIDEGAVWCGEVKFVPHPLRFQRIHRFVHAMASVPGMRGICIEGMVSTGGQASLVSGACGGLARMALMDVHEETDILLLEASPSVVKGVATGKGNADKGSVKLGLFKLAGVDFSEATDNESDACALAIVAAAYDGRLALAADRMLKARSASDLRTQAKETKDGHSTQGRRRAAA